MQELQERAPELVAPSQEQVGESVPLSYARAVGARIRDLRRQRGLSLLAVEAGSGREFKASVLGAYERGERVISVLRLQRLAQLYRVPVDQLLPRVVPGGAVDSGYAAGGQVPPVAAPFTVDLTRLQASDCAEADAVRRYVNTIQVLRGDFSSRAVTLRSADLEAVGRFFERDEAGMRRRLDELGLSG